MSHLYKSNKLDIIVIVKDNFWYIDDLFIIDNYFWYMPNRASGEIQKSKYFRQKKLLSLI